MIENLILVIALVVSVTVSTMHYLGFNPGGDLLGLMQLACFITVMVIAYRKLILRANPKTDSYDEYIRSIYDNDGKTGRDGR